MSDWKRIDSIADVRRGASPRPIGDPKYFGGEVGWVRISDVTRSSRFLRETEQYLSPIGESLSVRVNPGDLVMSICGTLGRPIMIDMPACIHDGFVQFTNLRNADTAFLFYVLQHAEAAFCGMGQPGTQTNLNTSLVGRHTIFCPSLPEQRRIAEILSTLDEAIEQTEALIAKMQQVKAGLMHDLFTRGVTPDGRLRPTREQTPELYKESPLGWIPKAWDCLTVDQLLAKTACPMRSGPFGSALLKDELVEEGIPFLGIDNILVERFSNNFHRFVPERKFQELIRYSVSPRDIIITIMGTVGRCCVVPEGITKALSSKHLWTMTFDGERVLPELVCWQLNHASWVKDWFARHSQGAVMEAIQSSTLRNLALPVPPMKEQRKVFDHYLGCSLRAEAEEENLRKLRHQKHGLMHDLLTGQVPVRYEGTHGTA